MPIETARHAWPWLESIKDQVPADVFQHSPFGDILNSLKSLSLSGEPWSDYGQQGWDVDDEEI